MSMIYAITYLRRNRTVEATRGMGRASPNPNFAGLTTVSVRLRTEL